MIDFKSLIDTLMRRGRDEEMGAMTASATMLLADMPRNESHRALTEIVRAIADLNRNPKIGLKERVKTVLLIDDKAQPLARLLTEVYRGTETIESLTPRHVLPCLQACYQELAAAYKLCIKQNEASPTSAFAPYLETVTLRATEYYARQALWAYVRYFPAEPTVWRNLNRLYKSAEDAGFADKMMLLHPGDTEHHSVSSIYKQAILLRLAEPDRRLPEQVWMLDSLLEQWARRVTVDMVVRPRQHAFAVDISDEQPASQFRRNMVGPNFRYFDTEGLVKHITELADQCNGGHSPVELGVITAETLPLIGTMLADLSRIWSRDGGSRTRRHERTVVNRSAIAAYGLMGVNQLLSGQSATGSPATRESSESTEWTLEDESSTGFGALYRDRFDDRLNVGEVVALRDRDGNKPTVGIIRRLTKSREGKVRVGIEKLGAQTSLVALVADDITLPALFSAEAPQAKGERCLLMPAAHYQPGRNFTLVAGSHRYLIRLGEALQILPGTTMAAFSVLEKQD